MNNTVSVEFCIKRSAFLCPCPLLDMRLCLNLAEMLWGLFAAHYFDVIFQNLYSYIKHVLTPKTTISSTIFFVYSHCY